MQLGQMQVVLGPVQPQLFIKAGERGFGWDGLLGGADCFNGELECRGGRVTRHFGGNCRGTVVAVGFFLGQEIVS